MDPQTVAVTWRIVIICGTLFFCWLVAWTSYYGFRKKQLQADERRTAIENGIDPPPPPPPQLAGWPGVRQQELQLKYAERRLLIERGLALPVEGLKTRQDFLRRGLVATCLGVGLALVYAGLTVTRVSVDGVADARAWAIGLAPLFLLYGVANLIYQRYVPEQPAQELEEKRA